MTGHCQHCDPDCPGGMREDGYYDWHQDITWSFMWAADRSCPVCRSADLLRKMSDDKSALAATSLDELEMVEFGAAADALRNASDRIESQQIESDFRGCR